MTIEEYTTFEEAMSWIGRAEEKIHDLRFNSTNSNWGIPFTKEGWQTKGIEGEIHNVCNNLNTLIYEFKSKHNLYDMSLERCSDYVEPDFEVEIQEPFKNK